MIALGILAAGLPVLAYCAAFQTGNIGVAVRDNIGEGPAKIGLVFPGSPADRAGVKTNWIILSIDGANMLGAACTNCMKLLHGPVGTSVTLELADPQNHQTNKFIIERQDVPLPENLFRNFWGTNAPEHQTPNPPKPFLISRYGETQKVSLPLLDGMWTGEDTNGLMDSSILSIRLMTNGHGAFISRSFLVGIPGTFTYTQLEDHLVLFTNDTPRLAGVIRYESAADILVYQESASVAKALHRGCAPVILTRDTNARNKSDLDCMIGAINYPELTARLIHLHGIDTNESGMVEPGR